MLLLPFASPLQAKPAVLDTPRRLILPNPSARGTEVSSSEADEDFPGGIDYLDLKVNLAAPPVTRAA